MDAIDGWVVHRLRLGPLDQGLWSTVSFKRFELVGPGITGRFPTGVIAH